MGLHCEGETMKLQDIKADGRSCLRRRLGKQKEGVSFSY